jgi:hypothetical protein
MERKAVQQQDVRELTGDPTDHSNPFIPAHSTFLVEFAKTNNHSSHVLSYYKVTIPWRKTVLKLLYNSIS